MALAVVILYTFIPAPGIADLAASEWAADYMSSEVQRAEGEHHVIFFSSWTFPQIVTL